MATNLRGELLDVLEIEAEEIDCDWKLLDAIIHVESSWNNWNPRYEPQFTYLVTPEKFAKKNRITLDTEMVCQKMSWGLMQVMGGTARWLGYSGSLAALSDPEVGIHIGAKYFATLMKRYGKLEDQIAAYNAGSPRRKADGTYVNQGYVDKVLKVLSTLD